MRKTKRRIRLLHIIGTFLQGGTERLMLDILSRLDRVAFDITACAYGNQQIPSIVHSYQRAGIHTITFSQETGWELMWALVRYIRQNRFDIVHTHHYQANMYCRPAAILAQTPVIMTYHHNWPGQERVRHRLMFRLLNPWTHRNVVISESIRRYYLNQVGLSADKVITICNGINTTLFRPRRGDEFVEARKSMGIPLDSIVIGAVGRFVDWKRLDLLISAVPKILKVHPDTYFVFAGDGEMREPWMQLARDFGVEERIRFTGWYADMPSLYRAMDIFCMTSESGGSRFSGEGFGLVSAEAMASGLPVVATDNTVNREVITEACGLFCRAAPRDITDKVCQLIGDTQLRSALGQAARSRAAKHFHIGRTVQQLSTLYEAAIGERSHIRIQE